MSLKNKEPQNATEKNKHSHYSEMFDDLFGNSSDIEKKSTKKKTSKNALVVCTNNDSKKN